MEFKRAYGGGGQRKPSSRKYSLSTLISVRPEMVTSLSFLSEQKMNDRRKVKIRRAKSSAISLQALLELLTEL